MIPRAALLLLTAAVVAVPATATTLPFAYFDFETGEQGWASSGQGVLESRPVAWWAPQDQVLHIEGESGFTVHAPQLPTDVKHVVIHASRGWFGGQDIAEVRNADGDTLLRVSWKEVGSSAHVYITDPEADSGTRPIHDHRWSYERYHLTFQEHAYTVQVGSDTATAGFLADGPPATLHMRPGISWMHVDNVRYHTSTPWLEASFEAGLGPLTPVLEDDGSPLFPTFVRWEPEASHATAYRSYGAVEFEGSFHPGERAYLRTPALDVGQRWMAEVGFALHRQDGGDGIAVLAGLDEAEQPLWSVALTAQAPLSGYTGVDGSWALRWPAPAGLTFHDAQRQPTFLGGDIHPAYNWSRLRLFADAEQGTLEVWQDRTHLDTLSEVDLAGTRHLAMGDVYDGLGLTRFARSMDGPSGGGALVIDDVLVVER